MKNFYFAVTTQENKKNYAYVIKASTSDNLLIKLCRKNVLCANICESKKKAIELAEYWNECYKANGTYMFDELNRLQNENSLRVCERCFMAICSREGDLEHKVLYVDEENEQASTCEWCGCSGYYKLYEI